MDNLTKEAVVWATNRLSKPPSTKTQAQYIKIFERLVQQLKEGKLPGTSNNRNTRSVERSAFRYCAARRIIENALVNEKYVKACFDLVKAVNADALQASKSYANGKSHPNTQKKRTKRRSLIGLPPNWRLQLVNLSTSSPYADAIRIMAICGCRPAELEMGVVLERQESTITITIKGAKCSKRTDAGQVSRTLTFDSNHPLIGNISAGTYQAKAHGICDAVSHFGKKISSKGKDKISAYSLRHAAASNFKASGLPAKDIAAALGHRSTATMSSYGTNSRGTGMLVLKGVSATSPVREARKNLTPKKQKI